MYPISYINANPQCIFRKTEAWHKKHPIGSGQRPITFSILFFHCGPLLEAHYHQISFSLLKITQISFSLLLPATGISSWHVPWLSQQFLKQTTNHKLGKFKMRFGGSNNCQTHARSGTEEPRKSVVCVPYPTLQYMDYFRT